MELSIIVRLPFKMFQKKRKEGRKEGRKGGEGGKLNRGEY